MRYVSRYLLTGLAIMATLPLNATASEPGWQLQLETGPAWFSRNDAQIPNDSEGDRIDVTELTGTGPAPYLRLGFEYQWDDRHAVTGLFAPLRTSGTSSPGEDLRFAGETFSADEPLKATYKFNTYRLGYRYRFHDTRHWRLRAGATVLVRDANIRLSQDGTTADDPDLGLVPLLAFDATRYLGNRWSVEFDVEGLAAPQGRAVDAALALQYAWNDRLTGRLGYRTLEGGADNDSVYTFAWIHYGLAGIRYHF